LAKPLIVALGGETFSFILSKVERSDLYGSRKRVPTDAGGRPCTRAGLTQDGSLLIDSGMSGQGYFTAGGQYVPRGHLVGVNAQGVVVESQASTLGEAQSLQGPLDPSAVLDLELLSVYQLEPEQVSSGFLDRLKTGEIFACDFNYATSLEVERAFILSNDQGVFALVGKPLNPDWVEEGARFEPPVEGAEEGSEDLDFEML
jgi:hypothetical protein